MNDLLGKALIVTVAAALAMSLLTDTTYATLGLSLLATAVLVPIACSMRLRRDLNSLVVSGLIYRHAVAGLVALWILPYYAARNSADAVWYDSQAGYLAELIRAKAWSQIHLNVGSDMVSFVTALSYLPFGPTAGGITFLSGLLGFIGSICFVGAAASSLQGRRLRGYAILVMMLPSLVFWSTLFGKDSWVFCGLGISAFGIARWLKYHRWSDFLKTLIGLGVVYAFRPHIALAAVLGLALTTVVTREHNAPRSVTKSVTVLLFMALMMHFMWQGLSQVTGLQEVSPESFVTRIVQQGRWTNEGGSSVEATEIEGPWGFISQLPVGAVRLLFRPWPWEATSLSMFVAALDSAILIGLLVVKWPNVLNTLRRIRSEPFAFFCVVLTIELIVIFSTIPNLGLLVRQKTQITPFLYLLAFSGNRRVARRHRSTRQNQAADAAWLSQIRGRAHLDSAGVAASRT